MSGMERKPTEFEQLVYAMLRRIPCGRVMTYGGLAKALGAGSGRAVGQALRRNPDAPEVPCHRVIRSDLSIGGYAGRTAGEKLRRKRGLLEAEGVRFDGAGRLADRGCLWDGPA